MFEAFFDVVSWLLPWGRMGTRFLLGLGILVAAVALLATLLGAWRAALAFAVMAGLMLGLCALSRAADRREAEGWQPAVDGRRP